MEVRARKLVLYQTANGKCPWQDWFSELKDRRGKAAIDARLQRVQRGLTCRGSRCTPAETGPRWRMASFMASRMRRSMGFDSPSECIPTIPHMNHLV